jgi:hypothetical protein
VKCLSERRDIRRVLVGKPEGKCPLGRPRIRWEENIKVSSSIGMGVWTGLICLRIGTGGGFF